MEWYQKIQHSSHQSSGKGREEGKVRKMYKEIITETSQIGQKIQPYRFNTWSKAQTRQSQRDTYTWQDNIIKILKTKDGHPENSYAKQHLAYQEKQLEWNKFSHKKPWTPERCGTILLRCWKNKVINPKYCTQWKYFQGMKGESRHSQMKGNGDFIANRSTLKE